MKGLVAAVALVACGTQPPKDATTAAQEWTHVCAARFDRASASLGVKGEPKVDVSPWNPIVHYKVSVGAGYVEAAVSHGRGACIDFDSDDPSFTNLAWTQVKPASPVMLDRIRRSHGDEATIEGDKLPKETLERFRAAFESALDACLVDANDVPVGKVPAGYSCMDKQDRCPDTPTPNEDGCPDH